MLSEMRQTTMTTTKPHPSEPENLPCPRCESTNTKFCYYNNYNLSQPRYFCKACRRYWTRGGTLRNVPIGGGSRKNSKRPRSSSSSSSSSSSAVSTPPLPAPPPPAAALNTTSPSSGIINLNDATSFMSLLTAASTNEPPPMGLGLGFGQGMGLGGFGFGSSMMAGSDGGGVGGGMMMDGGDYLAWAPELAISMTMPGKGFDLQ